MHYTLHTIHHTPYTIQTPYRHHTLYTIYHTPWWREPRWSKFSRLTTKHNRRGQSSSVDRPALCQTSAITAKSPRLRVTNYAFLIKSRGFFSDTSSQVRVQPVVLSTARKESQDYKRGGARFLLVSCMFYLNSQTNTLSELNLVSLSDERNCEKT